MNKTSKLMTFLLSTCLISITGCDAAKEPEKVVDLNNIVFRKDSVVLDSFEGLGVEWGTYEDPDKLSSDSWERSLKIMDRLNPQVTRP